MKMIFAVLSLIVASSAFASIDCKWVAKKSAARFILRNYDEGPVTIISTDKISSTKYLVQIDTPVNSHHLEVKTHMDHKFQVCRVQNIEEVQH